MGHMVLLDVMKITNIARLFRFFHQFLGLVTISFVGNKHLCGSDVYQTEHDDDDNDSERI